MNVSEISAFSSYYGADTMVAGTKTAKTANDGVNDPGKIYAAIDKDSAPQDASVGVENTGNTNVDITRPDGSKLVGYTAENRKLTDLATFEDDTDYAPSLIIGIDEADPTRGISGIVWDDASDEVKLKSKNERLGDGKYEENETLVENVKVELIENDGKNEKTAKIYKLSINGNDVEGNELDASTNSSKDFINTTNYIYKANYMLLGVIPAENYQLKYEYGKIDTNTYTTINNDKIIDARDYKSTIVVSNNIENALLSGDVNWIITNANETTETTRTSTAIDRSMDLRETSDDVYYGNYTDGSLKMTAKSGIFDFFVENNGKTNLTNSDKISWTDYKDEFEFDGEVVLLDNGKAKRVSTFYAVVPYLDFGITERPKQKINVDKTISDLTITLANGQNIIHGNPYKEHLNYVKALGGNESNRMVLAEIDNEIIEGATIKIEYEINITNYSEIDYDYRKNKDYYYWGKEGGPKLENVIFKLVDYMSGGLILDKEKNSENELEWKELSADDLLALDGKAYIEESVYKDLKDLEKQGKGYTILETDKIGNIAPPTEYNKAGGTTTVRLYASKVLAVDEKGVRLDNHSEVIETFKKIISPFDFSSTTPGNHNPSTGKPDECDDGEIRLVITPPTGISQHTVNTNIILISSIIVLTITAVGICLIKKNKIQKINKK